MRMVWTVCDKSEMMLILVMKYFHVSIRLNEMQRGKRSRYQIQ